METMSERVVRLLSRYAPSGALGHPLPPGLSIRQGLAIDSLSLVSILVALGEELAVDIAESGIELSGIQTVGDLVRLGDDLAAIATSPKHLATND
jgi:hypothetical protein